MAWPRPHTTLHTNRGQLQTASNQIPTSQERDSGPLQLPVAGCPPKLLLPGLQLEQRGQISKGVSLTDPPKKRWRSLPQRQFPALQNENNHSISWSRECQVL